MGRNWKTRRRSGSASPFWGLVFTPFIQKKFGSWRCGISYELIDLVVWLKSGGDYFPPAFKSPMVFNWQKPWRGNGNQQTSRGWIVTIWFQGAWMPLLLWFDAERWRKIRPPWELVLSPKMVDTSTDGWWCQVLLVFQQDEERWRSWDKKTWKSGFPEKNLCGKSILYTEYFCILQMFGLVWEGRVPLSFALCIFACVVWEPRGISKKISDFQGEKMRLRIHLFI